MRRAFSAILAAATLAAGLSLAPAAALAGDGDGYDRSYDRDCRCYRSRRGYWERPGDRRRGWNRYNHHRRDRDGVHYYPGYGYYPDRGSYRGHDRGDGRSEWCARRYRSYDWRTGYYRGYDGRLHYCG